MSLIVNDRVVPLARNVLCAATKTDRRRLAFVLIPRIEICVTQSIKINVLVDS